MINHLRFAILIHHLGCILRVIDPISKPLLEVLGTNKCPLLWCELGLLAVRCEKVISVDHRLCGDDVHLLADLWCYCGLEEGVLFGFRLGLLKQFKARVIHKFIQRSKHRGKPVVILFADSE